MNTDTMNTDTDLSNDLEATIIKVLTELDEDLTATMPPLSPIVVIPKVNPLRPQRNRTPQIPVKMIDLHTTVCGDCEKRRLGMKEIYKLQIDPDKHTNEYLARDIILENTLEECRECYIKSIKDLE